MSEEPETGSSLRCESLYWQPPVLVPPHASCAIGAEPLRAMLVDGTAAIETIVSPVAISFFVFDI
jgi:hypothetical protein